MGVWAFFLVVAKFATNRANGTRTVTVVRIIVPRSCSCIKLLIVAASIRHMATLSSIVTNNLNMTWEHNPGKCARSRLSRWWQGRRITRIS